MVKQGVRSRLININRYESYLRILCDVLNEKDYEKIIKEIKKKEK